MDVTDPSDPSVFFDSAISNANGKIWLKNEYKVSDSTEIEVDPELTYPVNILFSHDSIANFVNSNGLIEHVQPNVSRYDHDHVTLALKSLLLEESQTNLLSR
jgi:hypothetical protein